MKELYKEFVGDFATVDDNDFMSAILNDEEEELSFVTIKKIKIILEVEE